MTGRIWFDVIVGSAATLLLSWLVLVIILVIRRPNRDLLKDSLRLLPDPAPTYHQSRLTDRCSRPGRIAVRLPGHTDRLDPRLHSHPRLRRRCHHRRSRPAQRLSPPFPRRTPGGLARDRRRVRGPLSTGQTVWGVPCGITCYLITESKS